MRFLLLMLCSVLCFSCLAEARESALRSSGGLKEGVLEAGGGKRSYVYFAPSGAKALVVVLHGGGGNGRNAADMTGFTEIAKREGFAVVYPDGSGRLGGKLLTWNAVHCCGYAMERNIDEAAFFSALIDKFLADFGIDPKRVYVTGMSNGAMMTHRLGMALSDKIAAIAPVVGGLFGDESVPEYPLSALMINGGADKSVPPAGGRTDGRFTSAWDGTPLKPAVDQASFWANVARCPQEAMRRDETRQQIHWRYSCPEGRHVELYLLKDAGHAWPGGKKGSRRGDTPDDGFAASEVIWKFFREHPRP